MNIDRLRGHIFTNDDNSTVIIAIKGTSAGLLGRGGPTAKNVSPLVRLKFLIDLADLGPFLRIASTTICCCELDVSGSDEGGKRVLTLIASRPFHRGFQLVSRSGFVLPSFNRASLIPSFVLTPSDAAVLAWTSPGQPFAAACVAFSHLFSPLGNSSADLSSLLQYAGSQKCGQTCVERALIEESVYYPLALVPFLLLSLRVSRSQLF